MGQTQCKMLYLPAQSGKTRKMEKLIKKSIKKNKKKGRACCNFIISDNNIALTSQTTARVNNDLATGEKAVIEGGIFSWTSASGTCKMSEELSLKCNISVGELAWNISSGKVDTVVLCAHPTRFKYLRELITELCESDTFTKKINIFIDEADKSIKQWSKYISLLEYGQLGEVVLISATIDSIIKKYGTVRVLGYSETYPESYRGFKDSTKIVIDTKGVSVQDALDVLKANPKLMRPGKKGFIPMDVAKDTHDSLDLELRKLGFAVMTINGERKEIYTPDRPEPIDISSHIKCDHEGYPIEMNVVLAKFYNELELWNYPFGLTGRLCVGRGVTFQSNDTESQEGVVIDYEILPDISSADEAYQTAARGFGNVVRAKDLLIFASKHTLDKIESREKMAMNTAKMAEGKYIMVDKYVLKQAQTSCVVNMEPYDSFEQMAERWIALTGEKLRNQLTYDDGVYRCALGEESAVHTVDEILSRKYDKGTHEWGSGFGKKKSGEYVRRIYAGYNEDGSVTFFLRWAIKP